MKQLSSLLIILSLCLSVNTRAQNQATLQGKVTEAKSGDDAINAYVKLTKGGVAKTTVATDFEGNYSINIDPGTYDIEVSYVGMDTSLTKGVILIGGRITTLNAKLETNSSKQEPIKLVEYKISLVQDIGIRSPRKEGTIYIIDGVRIQGNGNLQTPESTRKKKKCFFCKKNKNKK